MPRQWVLKRGFERVFATRRSVSAGVLAVRWAVTGGAGSHIGISVARRVGNAVRRNGVKRRLRAAVRALLARVRGGYDVVIVARPGAAAASYQELAGGLQELLTRAGILNGEGASGCADGDRGPRADSCH